uniref:Uncharacterized protein n=1 Tax=Rhodnius prolixus TaxID=13249 RepID=T1HSM3_RHOPR
MLQQVLLAILRHLNHIKETIVVRVYVCVCQVRTEVQEVEVVAIPAPVERRPQV